MKNRMVAFVAMWLMSMATVLVAPASCAMARGCAPSADVAFRPAAQARASASPDASACHMPAAEMTGPSHCDMGGPCCANTAAPAAGHGSARTKAPVDAHSDQSGACLSATPDKAATAPVSGQTPTLDLAAILIPAPAPWIYLATHTLPHTPAPLLPPRDAVARPQGSRAPPASLA